MSNAIYKCNIVKINIWCSVSVQWLNATPSNVSRHRYSTVTTQQNQVLFSSSLLFGLMPVGTQLLRPSARSLVGDIPHWRLLVVILSGVFGAASEGNVKRTCDTVCSGFGRCRKSFVTFSTGVSTHVHTVKTKHFMETTFGLISSAHLSDTYM